MSIQPKRINCKLLNSLSDQITLYAAGDRVASMDLNPYLKVFCAAGYYDAVTPFNQTKLDIKRMPPGDPERRHNLFFHTYVRTYDLSGQRFEVTNEGGPWLILR